MPPVQRLDSRAYSVPVIREMNPNVPTLLTLYTPVILATSHCWAEQVSCTTDLSPTALFTPLYRPRGSSDVRTPAWR